MDFEVPSEKLSIPNLLMFWTEVVEIPEENDYGTIHLMVVGKSKRLQIDVVGLRHRTSTDLSIDATEDVASLVVVTGVVAVNFEDA